MNTCTHSNLNSFRLPPLNSIKSSYRAPWYLRIVRIIIKVVKKIFNFLCFWNWKKKDAKWTPQQVQTLDEIRDRQFEEVRRKYLVERNITVKNAQGILSDDTRDTIKVKVNSIYADKEFDPSLQAMRNLFGKITEHTTECIFEEYLEKALNIPESAMNEAAGYLKIFSTLLVNVGNQAQDQILNKITNDHDIQDGNIINRSLHKALFWLLSRENAYEINSLIDDLEEEITSKKLTMSSTLTDDTIEKVLQWIKNHRDFEFCGPHSDLVVDSNQLTINLIIENCIVFLISRKIDSLNDYLKSNLVKNLPNIVLNLMKNNGKILTDEFSGRIAEIFEHGSLEDYLERIIHTSTLHTKNYLSAREMVEQRIKDEKKSTKTADAKNYIDGNAPKAFVQLPTSHSLTHEIHLGRDEGLHHDN